MKRTFDFYKTLNTRIDIAIDQEEVSGLIAGEILHAVAIYEIKHETITRAWFAREVA